MENEMKNSYTVEVYTAENRWEVVVYVGRLPNGKHCIYHNGKAYQCAKEMIRELK